MVFPLVVLAGLVGACGGTVFKDGSGGGGGGGTGGGSSGGGTGGTTAGASYAGHGFVVHEWGTNTMVVGSDGSIQRGLHHEEEDLPAFVYDRVKAGGLPGSTSVDVKMETPVTYFYSDKPLAAQVSVGFPNGVLTQWYPAVSQFAPGVGMKSGGVVDPVMDPKWSSTCQPWTTTIANGYLDWGTVQILDRTTDVTPMLNDAPLDRYTWSHARAVASNPLAVSGVAGAMSSSQSEKFLFYRGLGNLPAPARVMASEGPAGYDGGVTITNADAANALGTVFVLNVGANGGAFTVHPEGVAGGASLSDVAPSLDKAEGLDAYAASLATAVTRALDATGLFHDEAVAMVNTWQRQWFRTPGIRVLYFAPQAWTDAQIPLTITPKPDATLRVMMIRVEVLTPATEDTDLKFAAAFGSDPSATQTATDHFASLGRFAEPRLRRALTKLGSTPPAAAQYLSQIATANTSAGFSE